MTQQEWVMHWRNTVGPMATKVYKCIATLLFECFGQSYSRTLHWLRCNLTFSLLCSALTLSKGIYICHFTIISVLLRTQQLT